MEAVFIGGAHDDFAPFAEFRTLRGAPLKEVIALIAGSSLLVGNDSGPAHVAAALGTPLVVLFGASDPLVWSPWKAHSRMLVAGSGMSSISVTDVLKAIESLKVAA
jgi:ADP-heptose:LPS heptosyltransferase